MTVRARQIIGARVAGRGRITRIAVAPAPFAVRAFSLRERWWRRPNWYQLATIVDFASSTLQMRSASAPCFPQELTDTVQLLRIPVRTAAGVSLGWVTDALFTVPAGEVLEIVVVSPALREMVVARSAVLSVTTECVVVRDASVPATTAVALGSP
ncbi:PRC-barrel domain-containing protein [Candidatus Parcubacteria bacterium]|nr:PRC-barrel domain-containing protein [Candidatus Parcubacteria bacterium]